MIALTALLAGAGAYLVSKIQQPVYEATATLLIYELPGSGASEYNAILSSERLARTYSEILTKRPVIQEVADQLGMQELDTDLITVQPVRDTQLIDITVEDNDPELAAAIANTLMDVFSQQNQILQASRFADSKQKLEEQLSALDAEIDLTQASLDVLSEDADSENEIQDLELHLAQLRQTYNQLLQNFESLRLAEAQSTSNIVVLETAIAPDEPIRPRVLLNTLLGTALGGMLAMGVLVMVQALDDTLKSPDDVKRHLALPVLGIIPKYETGKNSPIALSSPRSPICDAYRTVRANIHFAGVDQSISRLLITSANPGEGKTTLTVNLGVISAQHNLETVIIDSDFRRPAVSERFGLSNQRGLSDLFVDDFDPNDRVQHLDVPNPRVLTTGPAPPNPTELLGSKKMSTIIDRFGEDSDMLLIDTAPMMLVSDAAVLSSSVDGVLLMIKPGSTKIKTAMETIERLRLANANLVGVVLMGLDFQSSHDYYGAYSDYRDDD